MSVPVPSPVRSITLLHGVGMSPMLFADVVDLLAAGPEADSDGRPGAGLVPALASVPVHAPVRRGHRSGDEPPVSSFADLLADVADLVAAVGPTLLVGVSGGATLALAAALAGTPGVAAVVAHEPLVGPLVPALHDLVTAGAERLAASDPAPSPQGVDEAAVAFVAGLVGADVWARLPHEAHAFAARHAATVRREVPLFVGWRPDLSTLAHHAVPVVVSTGELSAAPRHETAAVLAAAGARSVVVPAAGHLAPWQRPSAFADVIVAAWGRTAGHLACDGPSCDTIRETA